MKIIEAINRINATKPNQYDESVMVAWLSELDADIRRTVIDTHEGAPSCPFLPYTAEDVNATLIVAPPFDVLYPTYLSMKIDEANGETTRYNNSSAMFNSQLMNYRRDYNRTHVAIAPNVSRRAVILPVADVPMGDIPVASESKFGVIKVGNGLFIDQAGVLHLDPLSVPKDGESVTVSITYDSDSHAILNIKDKDGTKVVDLTDIISNEISDSHSSITTALASKANSSDVYNKENTYSKSQVDSMINGLDSTYIKKIYNNGSLVEVTNGEVNLTISDGTDGKSAYEVAVDNGFSGTESEWLLSLHGSNGTTPVKGVDYFDGQNGYTPVKGVDYFDGKDGKTPVKGIDYFDGTNGVSPTVELSRNDSGIVATITDADGNHEFLIPNGTNGTNGKSAYEIAVQNGFSGSQSEWLESLKGTGKLVAYSDSATSDTIIKIVEEEGEEIDLSDEIADAVDDYFEENPVSGYSGYSGDIVEDESGSVITITDSANAPVKAFTLYGKTTQDGTPSPDNPIDLVSVENPKVTVFKENLITLPYRATSSGTVTMNGVTFTVSESGTIHAEGTATANTFFVINEPWLAQGTYYLRAKGAISANARFQIFEYDSSFPIIYAEVNTSESNVSITIPSFARVKLAFRVASGATLNGDFDFCFARTDVDEVYPIIAPSSVSLPYTLRSIGDVHDELRVNADGSGEFVQRISNEKSITSFNGFYVFSYVSCNDYLPVSGRTKVMSNRFIFKNSEKTNGICFGYGNQLRFYLADDVTNVGEANAWLAEHPTTYCYPLAEPIVTPLTASEVSAILALQTHKPITNIMNDGGADMSVSYYADTKNYIDKKLDAISASINALAVTE